MRSGVPSAGQVEIEGLQIEGGGVVQAFAQIIDLTPNSLSQSSNKRKLGEP